MSHPLRISARALVAAAARLLTTGDRPDRAAFLARALNGLADVVPALGVRTLDEAVRAQAGAAQSSTNAFSLAKASSHCFET